MHTKGESRKWHLDSDHCGRERPAFLILGTRLGAGFREWRTTRLTKLIPLIGQELRFQQGIEGFSRQEELATESTETHIGRIHGRNPCAWRQSLHPERATAGGERGADDGELLVVG